MLWFKAGVCGTEKFITVLTRVKIWILAKLKIPILILFARYLIYVPSSFASLTKILMIFLLSTHIHHLSHSSNIL
jgi:hypothetical protein